MLEAVIFNQKYQMIGESDMRTTNNPLNSLLAKCITNEAEWEILTDGNEDDVLELSKKHRFKGLTRKKVTAFIKDREKTIKDLTKALKNQNRRKSGRAVDLFRKGIRVLDSSDPTYYGIS